MTPDEIKLTYPFETPSRTSTESDDLTFWMKEIAYQLAVMNERNAPPTWAEAMAQADAAMLTLKGR